MLLRGWATCLLLLFDLTLSPLSLVWPGSFVIMAQIAVVVMDLVWRVDSQAPSMMLLRDAALLVLTHIR